ncbi:HD domain-containing protein [Vibrio maerlii]|uniref:HD domain-containing protein n=1 Tax=Vibrio maerlii TaxID=2231648 RepID=UPI000E3BA01F|nr:HD domain-containing protein [Vibrio maerlii]
MNLTNYEQQFKAFIEKEMTQDLAHDMSHVLRVVSSAKKLCIEEEAMLEVVLPAAYLHDCFSYPKDHPDRRKSSVVAADKAIDFLQSIGYPEMYFESIHHAIVAHSYSADIETQTVEAKIVQDADRLDALGAVGIARCIQVSSGFGSKLYSVDDPFGVERELADKQFAVDHFYTKLFKLVNKLNTKSARKEGERRTRYMKAFLDQLKSEIE